ncbi:antitoxin VbhA family protein [Brevibacillus sp. NRS-1366]|uniref:antitoxin VbhA family protein n=1 Tax=Brevibacillus sp. NRS-1366 TaxID=3233899 RepID=UPI003D242A09
MSTCGEIVLKNAKVSLEIEGYRFTQEEDELLLTVVKGEIAYEEFLKKALEIAKKSK